MHTTIDILIENFIACQTNFCHWFLGRARREEGRRVLWQMGGTACMSSRIIKYIYGERERKRE